MNEFVKMTIDGYLSVFQAFNITDESFKEDLDKFKNDLNEIGEHSDDPAGFSERISKSDLMSRYTDLINRASNPSKGDEENKGFNIPTVKEFLEQYRSSYNEILKSGNRKRAEKAYENIFNVADRTQNMLDAQIILEEERLLWKIVSEDMLDVYENLLKNMDPLSRNTTIPIKLQLEVWKKSDSDEEASYLIELAEKEKIHLLEIENFKMTMVLVLTNLLIGYNTSKTEFRMWGSGGNLAKSGLMKMIVIRENTKKAYEILVDKFGIDFNCILNDEWLKLWMLVPSNLDENGKIKMSMDPFNLQVYQKILFDEILCDTPIEEILLREQEEMLRYALHKRTDEVTAKYLNHIKTAS